MNSAYIITPLQITDVRAKRAKVSWEKPQDDGGSPITQYIIEKMDAETGRWDYPGILKLGSISQYNFPWAKIITNHCISDALRAVVTRGREVWEREAFVYFLAQWSYTICVIFWEVYPMFTIAGITGYNAINAGIIPSIWDPSNIGVLLLSRQYNNNYGFSW